MCMWIYTTYAVCCVCVCVRDMFDHLHTQQSYTQTSLSPKSRSRGIGAIYGAYVTAFIHADARRSRGLAHTTHQTHTHTHSAGLTQHFVYAASLYIWWLLNKWHKRTQRQRDASTPRECRKRDTPESILGWFDRFPTGISLFIFWKSIVCLSFYTASLNYSFFIFGNCHAKVSIQYFLHCSNCLFYIDIWSILW